MAKKSKKCRCGSKMRYYAHTRSWRCNQTGQLSANCNQVRHLLVIHHLPEPEPEEAD